MQAHACLASCSALYHDTDGSEDTRCFVASALHWHAIAARSRFHRAHLVQTGRASLREHVPADDIFGTFEEARSPASLTVASSNCGVQYCGPAEDFRWPRYLTFNCILQDHAARQGQYCICQMIHSTEGDENCYIILVTAKRL